MRHISKSLKKVLSYILVFAIILQSAYYGGTKSNATATTKKETQNQMSTTPQVLEEEKSLRTEYSKTFHQSDGTYLQVYSNTPLHSKKNGEYVNINNCLEKVENETKTYWKNKRGKYDVTFPKTIKGKIKVTNKDYSLQIQMKENADIESVTGSAVTATGSAIADVENESVKADFSKQNREKDYSQYLPYNKGTIAYESKDGLASVQYETYANKIKESIVLDSTEAAQESYVYEIDADGLKAKKKKDGSIVFYQKKENKPVYLLEAPYMFDSSDAQETSRNIKVSLKKKKDNLYEVTYAPDEKWLTDEKRVYPVTIDPTIYIGGSMYSDTSELSGVTISASSPDGRSNSSIVDLNTDKSNAYLFKTNVIPGHEVALLSAKLQLESTVGDSTAMVGVKEITSDCDFATVSWNNKPTVSDTWMDYTNLVGDTVSLDITPYAESVRAKGENNGVWLEWFGGEKASFWGLGGNEQILYVTEYASFHKDESEVSKNTYSTGRSGSFTVYNATGYAQYEGEDLGTTGNRMPVTIKRVYDGVNASAVGMGHFRTNYHQTLRYREDINAYELQAEDGSRIEFGVDENVEGYELNLDAAEGNEDYANIVITNPSGYTLHFDLVGRLIEIRGAKQKVTSAIKITYTTTTGKKINQIMDGAGGRYKFVYSSGNVSKIQYLGVSGNDALKTVNYSYEDMGTTELVTVTYPNSKSATFFFNEKDQLYQIADPSNRWLQMRYDEAGRMYQIWENGAYGSMGDRVTYRYAPMQTTLSDENGNVNKIQFSRKGEVTGVRNQYGEAVVASTGKDGALLGFSDICSSAIGDNLTSATGEFYDAPYGDQPLTLREVTTETHDDSISVLAGKTYETIQPNKETTTYTQRGTLQGSFPAGYKVTFGGWLKGTFHTGTNPTRGISIQLTIAYADKTYEYITIEPNTYITDWQYLLHEYQLEKEAKRFSVNLKFIRQTNPISVSQLEIKCKKGDYTAEEEIEEEEKETVPTPTSSADAYGNILYSKDEEGVENTTTYDDYGNVKTEKVAADGKLLSSKLIPPSITKLF